jgi:prefoldin subunit 5
MRVALAIMRMVYFLYLPTLAWKKKKLNELIETINKKDDLLECQEDLLVKENKKFVKLKNAYDQEVENCENLSKELSICHDSISSLRTENASLVSKIEKLNVCNDSISSLRIENGKLNTRIEELNACKPSISTIDHVTICTRCRDVNIEAMDDNLAMIKQQNDHIAKLTAKITEHELENEKFKFARRMLYNGRRPGIKDGIGFQQGNQNNTKLNAPKKLSNFVKGKAPMIHDSEGYILYPANYPEHKIRKNSC